METETPSDGPENPDLDDVLIEALGIGMSYADAGALVSRTSRTVARRMADRVFAERVAQRRAAAFTEILGELQQLAPTAIRTIREGMTTERPADQLRAAEIALRQMRSLHQSSEADRLIRETKALLQQVLDERGEDR